MERLELRCPSAHYFKGDDNDVSKISALKAVAEQIKMLDSMNFHAAASTAVALRCAFFAELNASRRQKQGVQGASVDGPARGRSAGGAVSTLVSSAAQTLQDARSVVSRRCSVARDTYAEWEPDQHVAPVCLWRMAPWQERHCTPRLLHMLTFTNHRPWSVALHKRSKTLVPRSAGGAVSLRTPGPSGNRPSTSHQSVCGAW